jgi:hypothetical protein
MNGRSFVSIKRLKSAASTRRRLRLLTVTTALLCFGAALRAQTNTFPATGSVGIGTTTPASPLSVVSSTQDTTTLLAQQSDGSTFSVSALIYNAATSGNVGAGVLRVGTAQSDNPGLVMLNIADATAERFKVFDNGNVYVSGSVGVGTANPQGLLNVGGPVYGGYWYGSGGLAPVTGIVQSDNNTSLAGNTPALLLYNSDPTAGNFNQIMFASLNTNSTPVGIASIAAQADARTGSWGQGELVFSTSRTGSGNTEAMRINGSGNVGIGTTTPQHLLHVAGTVGAEEVIVSATGADYVFQPDYHLVPLSNVNTYIQEHQHLPGIPSAAEMQKDGVNVGDLQVKLLAKVEELTLHMIQLEEENGALKDRVKRLEQGSDTSHARADNK